MLKRKLPPNHPGTILKEMFIDERKLTITEVAAGFGHGQGKPLGYCEWPYR